MPAKKKKTKKEKEKESRRHTVNRMSGLSKQPAYMKQTDSYPKIEYPGLSVPAEKRDGMGMVRIRNISRTEAEKEYQRTFPKAVKKKKAAKKKRK